MMSLPIFEPELSFLPFGCNECGARTFTEADLELHKHEMCPRRPESKSKGFNFEISGGRGIADGGRRT
jgi:hypothetical protein